jgi:hypothetical protein
VLGQLIPLALVVALSPLTIIPAIVLVLQSDRARSTGLAFLSGWLLGLILVNPKVLVMNAAAGLAIGTAGWGVAGTWLAVAYYTVLAGSTVLIPILAYAIAGQRVDHQLVRLKQWMERQHAALMAGFLAVVGLLLVYTGIRAV